MRYLLVLVSLYFFSCSDKQASGSSSETQNAKIELDSITYIGNTAEAGSLHWVMGVSDSLTLSLFPPQLNKKMKYEDFGKIEEWSMKVISDGDTLIQPLDLYDVKVFEADTVVIDSKTYVDFSLEVVWESVNIKVEQRLFIEREENVTVVGKKGVTWNVGKYQFDSKAWYASCDGTANGSQNPAQCDTLSAVTSCSESYRMLCQVYEQKERPSYSTTSKGLLGINALYSQGWGGGGFNFTEPLLGSDLISRANADQVCKNKFGPLAKMADYSQSLWHEDMSLKEKVGADFYNPQSELKQGGWGFWMYLPESIKTTLNENIYNMRFWVGMSTQEANCWN